MFDYMCKSSKILESKVISTQQICNPNTYVCEIWRYAEALKDSWREVKYSIYAR